MSVPAAASGEGRGGFALAMVVLLLFAVGVAGATAYNVVRLEAEMAIGSGEGSGALDAAHAGLQRYLAESLGRPDTISYTVGDGSATVAPRKVGTIDADTDLYLLRSTGTVSDDRYPNAPARRVVSQYAYLHRQPVADTAALLVAYGGTVSVNDPTVGSSYAEVSGIDQAGPSACSAPAHSMYGVIKPNTASAPTPLGRLSGSPDRYQLLSAPTDVIAAAKVRWDVLQNPSQPVGPWDTYWPPSTVFTNHPDSFPVIRVAGDLLVTNAHSGRGILIVPGTFNIYYNFHWDGIILAGAIGPYMSPFSGSTYSSSIDGILIGGLDGGSASNGMTVQNLKIRQNRCYVWAANENLAYFEPLAATWWEGV